MGVLSRSSPPYFFGYKTECFFLFQNNPKNLDPSYKDGSRSLGLFRKGKTLIISKFHRTDLYICSHSREGKTLSYSRINMVLFPLGKDFYNFSLASLVSWS